MLIISFFITFHYTDSNNSTKNSENVLNTVRKMNGLPNHLSSVVGEVVT